jgi:hypothetical protein
MFGQDEAIYNQNLVNSVQWVSPDGERPILPKNNGMGKMISAMQSRETGFGSGITEDQLKEVNRRREGQEYYDKDAAIAVNGTSKKRTLTADPFIRTFAFGGTNGFWTGNHTLVQVEDCFDCFYVLFGCKIECVMQFDHSSGHAKKRINGLDVKGMNKEWGGSNYMRPTMIKSEDGFVGSYYDKTNPRMVKVGENQTMVYDENDLGPFHLTENERANRMYDKVTAIPVAAQKATDVLKKDLVRVLMGTDFGKAMGTTTLLSMRLSDLQSKANALDIPTKITETEKTTKGWVGKPKGIFQVLWERGFIDSLNCKKYRMTLLDENGELVPEFSLVHLLENCTDFMNEKTQLEYICECLGGRAVITTKYHCEYAGEGIEYSWGYSKAMYRRAPLRRKKGKQNFDSLVAKCISREMISKDMVRKFSKRARQYMVGYKLMEMDANTKDECQQKLISQCKIERMKKVLKTHRAALDFDSKFVFQSVAASDFNWDNEIETDAKREKKLGQCNKRKIN